MVVSILSQLNSHFYILIPNPKQCMCCMWIVVCMSGLPPKETGFHKCRCYNKEVLQRALKFLADVSLEVAVTYKVFYRTLDIIR